MIPAGDVLGLTEALVRRASVTPRDEGCQALIGERLESVGFRLHDLSRGAVSNLLALREADAASDAATGPVPLLLFLGHTDVVPPGPLEQWQTPPFEPTHRNGMLHGRGTADMKGSVAAWVTACERYLTATSSCPLRLGVLLTSDEEGPAQDGIRAVAPALPDLVGEVDWCLVGEPSSHQRIADTIRVGRRGSLSGAIRVPGRQGHVAYPEQADNPIHRLAPFLAALGAEVWDAGTELFPPTSLQITGIDADTDAGNVIPGGASARFNIRFSPALDAEAIQRRIEAIRLAEAPAASIDWHLSAEPFESQPGPLRQAVEEEVADCLGASPHANTAGGTSDGRFIAPLGAEVVELGPVNATIHQIDERVAAADLETLTRLYEGIIKRLSSVSPPE
ncbi:succinyl-diaminopimelate desuccinylase [Spiribacter sp. 2438]|uniref:succinyl-diaminopimelate desuccinylase n=1 Tax=Spiribacter sp. 2438 TaxID=2666185 RepID=UPI001E555E3A|nr:succinyl-diaminopimelate desuccinylase [Spiribacter sp. 2438]